MATEADARATMAFAILDALIQDRGAMRLASAEQTVERIIEALLDPSVRWATEEMVRRKKGA